MQRHVLLEDSLHHLTESTSSWNEHAVTDLLHAHLYPAVVDAVDAGLGARDTRVVDWCHRHGLMAGHVPPLYKFVRNALRFTDRVPSRGEHVNALLAALCLLVRVAQDVVTAQLDLAKSDRDFVYPTFRNKLWGWIKSGPSPLPPLNELWAPLRQRLETAPALPSPCWVASFAVSCVSTFSFNVPLALDVDAFARNRMADITRANVAGRFLLFVDSAGSLSEVFSAPLEHVMAFGVANDTPTGATKTLSNKSLSSASLPVPLPVPLSVPPPGPDEDMEDSDSSHCSTSRLSSKKR
jgi:hypothetical protein